MNKIKIIIQKKAKEVNWIVELYIDEKKDEN